MQLGDPELTRAVAFSTCPVTVNIASDALVWMYWRGPDLCKLMVEFVTIKDADWKVAFETPSILMLNSAKPMDVSEKPSTLQQHVILYFLYALRVTWVELSLIMLVLSL
jgi:hypothetical protein